MNTQAQIRANQLKGELVYSTEGKLLGKITGVILDYNSGRIDAVLVDTQGEQGEQKTMPWWQFSKNEEGLLICNGNQPTNNKNIKDKEIPSDEEFLGNLPKHYHIQPFWERYPSL